MENLGLTKRAGRRHRATGFTLLEVIAALAILGLVSSSVLVVINRCITSAANSALRMEAFTLARENLEKILVSESVEEDVQYGTSDRYSDISWQTVIETFSEPISGQMWVRAVCTATYTDSADESQEVKLVHWIAPLTEQQAGQLAQQADLEQLGLEQLLTSVEEAAKYARVDVQTIQQWVKNGLVKTDEDMFIKCNLDVFVQGRGQPTVEQKSLQVKSIKELALRLRAQGKEALGPEPEDEGLGWSNEKMKKMNMDRMTEGPR